MTRLELVRFLRKHRLAVQASVSARGGPQAAVVGVAVSDGLEIVFDILTPTFWVLPDRTVVSLNLAVELGFKL